MSRRLSLVLVLAALALGIGFYGIESVKEDHSAIGPHTGGIGQQIDHELNLVPVGQPGVGPATDLLSQLISLFG